MSTVITEVQGTNIAPITLIDLTIDTTTYHISSHYIPVTVGSGPSAITYNELGNFLNVNEIVDDLKYNTGDLQVTLSGIPSNQDYVGLILANPVKGSNVVVKRAFVDTESLQLTSNVYTRFSGVISNYNINESFNYLSKQNDYTVTITVASLTTVLKNKITGQRTNPDERKRLYPNDKSFDRIPILYNTSFDFGKEYAPGSTGGYNGGGSGGGGSSGGSGGGGGGGRDRNDRREMR